MPEYVRTLMIEWCKKGASRAEQVRFGSDARGIGDRACENVYYGMRIQIAAITLYPDGTE
jgi:hypothetical protein